MSKTSTYRNPAYVLSFGVNDVVTLDIEILITRYEKEEQETFEMEVKQARLNCTEMEFACWLVTLLGFDGVKKLNERIVEALKAELGTQLFSLFYVGEIT